MKPALSVIFFTVMSGVGYGLWCLLGIALALGVYGHGRNSVLVPLAAGFVFVTAGLVASTTHLGRPERAWRALTQWDSSWLSREGLLALATYLPALLVGGLARGSNLFLPTRIAGGVLAACALATLFCTARIYTSLKPVAAWRDPRVLPLYLMFAGLSGGLWAWTYLLMEPPYLSRPDLWPPVLLVLCVLAIVLKVGYWRALRGRPAADPGHATGLDHLGEVRPFEGPATERSYLTREMAFVLARKHAARLHVIALVLFGVVPLLALVTGAWLLPTPWDGWMALAGAVCCCVGLFVERWLFFAEASHAVAAYFPAQQPD